jgi:transposase
VVLLRELRQRGYQGSYTRVKDYLQPRRQQADCVAVRRFETPPGKQGQVDWGDLGTITYPDTTQQTLSSFVLNLGHSRAMFAEVTLDQKLPTLLAMHELAFAHLGGVPQEILYDNMKTVVLETLTQGVDERGEIRWNPTFWDFARYWGFTPRLCRPYRPQTKGKVESGVKYVRRNFLCGRNAADLADLQLQLQVWLAEVANQRTHGTTHRVVQEAWLEEKPFLQQVGTRPAYPCTLDVDRQVAVDAFVAFRTNRYPVPWQAVGKEVVVRLTGDWVQMLCEGQILVTHPLCQQRYQTLDAGELHKGMPFGPSNARRKTKIAIRVDAPVVEQRSLEVYSEGPDAELAEYSLFAEGVAKERVA